MKGKMLDMYEKWDKQGILNKHLKVIKDMIAKRSSQKQVSEYLGITEKTLIKLKKAHPKLDQAFIFGNDELKYNLINAMLKRALGYEYEEIQTVIEENKTGTKKKIVKNVKRALPDYSAIRYLLIIKFGRDYNERREEIDLMKQRLEKNDEVWTNDNNKTEGFKAKKLRKQPKAK